MYINMLFISELYFHDRNQKSFTSSIDEPMCLLISNQLIREKKKRIFVLFYKKISFLLIQFETFFRNVEKVTFFLEFCRSISKNSLW